MEGDDDIGSEYDVIVIGTGLVESIFAAAAARVGKSVLHLDNNSYYSANWAVFGWRELQEWISKHTKNDSQCCLQSASTPVCNASATPHMSSDWRSLPIGQHSLIANVRQHISVPEANLLSGYSTGCKVGGDIQGDTAASLGDAECTDSIVSCSARSRTGTTDAPDPGPDVDISGCDNLKLSNDTQGFNGDNGDCAQGDEKNEEILVTGECFGDVNRSTITDIPPNHDCDETNKTSDSLLTRITDADDCSESNPGLADNAKSCRPHSDESEAECWTISRFKQLNRKFNLELSPKLLFSRGPMVELLISSNTARYVQFRCVDCIASPLHGQLVGVPCTRSDVFTSTAVSVVEKRLLMKLLTACTDRDQHEKLYTGFEQRPFVEFLRSQRLTESLIHYVVHAIAMVTPDTPTPTALIEMQRFLGSIGRYGKTPFLWTMYGSGELPQCFCRMCAVFGGVYHLSRGVEALVFDSESDQCRGIVSRGIFLRCSCVVLNAGSFAVSPDTVTAPDISGRGVSRAILLLDAPLYWANVTVDEDLLTLVRLPAGICQLPVSATVLQFSSSSAAVPEGLFLVHITCEKVNEAEEDLRQVVELLLNMSHSSDREAPRLLTSVYFNILSGVEFGTDLPSNVSIANGPDSTICFETAVNQARVIFNSHFPDEEFLPRMPDPDEIIYFDEDVTAD